MLKAVFDKAYEAGAAVKVADAVFPAPFASGLEYGAPARGVWNIVHTGMLIPGAHQIFVCAQQCLRGVVLTAAEMNAAYRFSTIAIEEHNVIAGDMEQLIIDGVRDILNRMSALPPLVLLYTSCIHHFMGCDLQYVFRRLKEDNPAVSFVDCYMDPIMRKSGLTPDQKMRLQLYAILDPVERHDEAINYIGNDLSIDQSSDITQLIRKSGKKIRDITTCETYEEYLDMAKSRMNITFHPAAKAAGEDLERRLGQKHMYLPQCFCYDEIDGNLALLAQYLDLPEPDTGTLRHKAEKSLQEAGAIIGNASIAIDYTAVTRPLGLARLLLEHGFNVTSVYADSFCMEERDDFRWLQKNRPELKLFTTVHHEMRVLPRKHETEALAIGQKAAYFTGCENFVNIVEGGGMYGYDGICRLCGLMIDAYLNPKNIQDNIRIKGLGCGGCCL